MASRLPVQGGPHTDSPASDVTSAVQAVGDSRYIQQSAGAAGHGLDYNGSAWVVDDRPVDLWNTAASPSGVTDWGPAINALGGVPVYLGPHDFPFSTQLARVAGSKLIGAGGLQTSITAPTICRLIWTGTGGTNAILVDNGCLFEDFALMYNNGGFTGSLLDERTTSGVVHNRIFTGSPGLNLVSAHAVAMLDNGFGTTFRDCIIGGANSGIRGLETAGSSECTSVFVTGGMCYGCPNGFFVNIGDGWKIGSIRFEMYPIGGGPHPKIINNDIATGNASFILRDFLIEDSGAGQPTAINQVAGEVWDCLITGGRIESGNLGGMFANFAGAGYIRVVDNPGIGVSTGPVMDLGDGVGGAFKSMIRVTGNGWTTAQAPGNPDILHVQSQVLAGSDIVIENNGNAPGGPLNIPSTRPSSLKENVNRVTTSGAAQTIPDITVATISFLTLTANCTLTFPTISFPQVGLGQSFLLALKQDGTGSRTVTWPGTVIWPAGTAPTLTTTAGKTDVLSFMTLDGVNWIGLVMGQNFTY